MSIRFLVPHRVASELLEHTPTVASVSVRFRSKERGTINSQRRVKERKEDGSRSYFPAAKINRNIRVS